MHIKTSSWEASSTVCEPDGLCDSAVLEPQIRNRRLSPGSSGGGGGGGGGGCVAESNPVHQQPRKTSPRNQSPAVRKAQTSPEHRTIALRKAHHKGRSSRREKKERRAEQRWVEDSLSLLKPPPAFPVQDSPAKLQPAVSYASKVKAGAATGCVEVLLQNQWGLSFISEARPVPESPAPSPLLPPLAMPLSPSHPPEATPLIPPCPPEAMVISPSRPPEEDEENNSKLLLSCHHLVEALNYHSREWNTLFSKEKKDPRMVVWFEALQENPA